MNPTTDHMPTPETKAAGVINATPTAADRAARLLYLATLAEELGAEEVSEES